MISIEKYFYYLMKLLTINEFNNHEILDNGH